MGNWQDTLVAEQQEILKEISKSLDLASSLIIQIPIIEIKVLLGYHLQYLVQSLSVLNNRVLELGIDISISSIRANARNELMEEPSVSDIENALDVLRLQYESALQAISLRIRDPILNEILDQPTFQSREIVKNYIQNCIADIHSVSSENEYLHFESGKFITSYLWKVMPFSPARDSRFDMTGGSSTVNPEQEEMVMRFHRTLMSLEIPTIEAVAQNIIEGIDLPIEFIIDMGRQAWDEARHANAFIALLSEQGIQLGSYGISCDLWELTYKHPIPLRLAIHQRIGETIGFNSADWWSDLHKKLDRLRLSDIYKIIFLDEISHVANGNKWIHYFTFGNIEKKNELIAQAIFIRSNQKHGVIDGQKIYPINRSAMLAAGYTAEEIELL